MAIFATMFNQYGDVTTPVTPSSSRYVIGDEDNSWSLILSDVILSLSLVDHCCSVRSRCLEVNLSAGCSRSVKHFGDPVEIYQQDMDFNRHSSL